MTIVHHEIAPKGNSCKVVDAAGAISHISHDQGLDPAKLFQDVRDGAGKNQETLWELQCDY